MNERPIVPPPLPSVTQSWSDQAREVLRYYTENAIRADRAAAEKKAGPVVHRARLELGRHAQVTVLPNRVDSLLHTITLAWTDKYAIIDSERNRELALRLRNVAEEFYLRGGRDESGALCDKAADALDGGVSP